MDEMIQKIRATYNNKTQKEKDEITKKANKTKKINREFRKQNITK